MTDDDQACESYYVQCPICETEQFRATLSLHLQQTCMLVRRLPCDKCKWCTFDPVALKAHLARHEKRSVYACPECSFTASRKHPLIVHRRIHTKERPYQCPECSYTARTTGHLRIHQSTHSDVKPFECPQCQMRFTQKSNLNQHIKRHAQPCRVTCTDCRQSFTRSSLLLRHRRRVHGHHPRPRRRRHCSPPKEANPLIPLGRPSSATVS